jgi:molecular chaperone DnaK
MTVYGIDLGTTYSCIAKVGSDGKPVVLANADGQLTTPSVVYFEAEDQVHVGVKARLSREKYPDLVCAHPKRDMGTGRRWSFHGQKYSPEEVSALILRKLAEAPDDAGNEPVKDVVISVPAYFGIAEKQATRQAGAIAGLTVLDVVPEPVAAALYYHAGRPSDTPRNLFVYDLGGGTFDTTVIRISGDDVQVVCIGGERKLGGVDFDEKVKDFLLGKFLRRYPHIDPGDYRDARQLLALTVEGVRQSLSEKESRAVSVNFAGESMQVELSRSALEEFTATLLRATMQVTERTKETAARHGITGFSDVLLVGGMSRMPAIRTRLRGLFGFEPVVLEPDLAVAKGAAIYAASAGRINVAMGPGPGPGPGPGSKPGPRVKNVLSKGLGLKVFDRADPLYKTDRKNAGRIVEFLFPAQQRLPADSGLRSYATAFDDQESVLLEVYEQAGSIASPQLKHNTLVASGRLADLPGGLAGREFKVAFTMNEAGELRVYAREDESGQEVDFKVQIGQLSPAEVEQARKDGERIVIGD